jgi:hypothetical protein
MPNQKISELTAIVTVDNSVDVLPIVDISANTTKKVTPNALKTALALDNVNNTSDANKPVSIAQQDALNAKVDENAPITAGTAPKITYDAKGLVTSGDSLDETDLPTGINANKIGTGVVSTTEFEYLNGVTSAIQTQIDGKQATLVSGTNIKTINSTSLLGSGDIAISANPSGVAGAIQFSNGSAFASDAANLFWDDTNNRLGVGTNTPTTALDISAPLTSIFTLRNGATNFLTTRSSGIAGVDTGLRIWENSNNFTLDLYGSGSYDHPQRHRFYIGGAAGERFLIGTTTAATIKGSGSTSATTSLLVQNSAGNSALRVLDDQSVGLYSNSQLCMNSGASPNSNSGLRFLSLGSGKTFIDGWSDGTTKAQNYPLVIGSRVNNNGSNATNSTTAENGTPVVFGSDVYDSSALVQMNTTTRGFLPPRMTTTQKNTIASPASGLILYDSTTNKLQCYNGSTWNDLF